MKKLLSWLFILLFSLPLLSQKKVVAVADKQYEEYSFTPAIDIYQKVLDKGFESEDLLKKLGNSYYFNANYTKSAEIYGLLVEKYPEETGAEYYFRYGQSLKSIGDYENSDKALEKFRAMTSGRDTRANRMKSRQEYMDEIAKNSGRYDLKEFPYNSKYSDFAPTFYKEGLIFSSDRDTGNLARYRHTWNSHDFLDLYKVDADSSSKESVTKLSAVNSRLHESTSVVSSDGSVIYFTRNNFVEGKTKRDEKGFIRLKIFRAQWTENGWDVLEELPFNSDAYSVAHPTLSPDDKTLYFASDMPGTYGQSDIFKVSVNDDGTFGNPENLGPEVNTEGRESFPFITTNKILYFASDGHPGLGGLDIFATNIENNRFSKIVLNVGEPVNSMLDDFSFIINEDTK